MGQSHACDLSPPWIAPVDNTDNPRSQQWGPSVPAITAVALAGILMAIGCATVATDPAGRFLTGMAAVGVADLRRRVLAGPSRLRSSAGLVYRGWLRTQTLRRADIESIRITQFRRWGRTVRLLEIDTHAGQLLVLSRWDLGGDPLDVLDAHRRRLRGAAHRRLVSGLGSSGDGDRLDHDVVVRPVVAVDRSGGDGVDHLLRLGSTTSPKMVCRRFRWGSCRR